MKQTASLFAGLLLGLLFKPKRQLIFNGLKTIYKESSIISGTGAAAIRQVTLGLLATITLQVVPFHGNAPFQVLLPFVKFIVEVVF
jgi:hypothetical protein